jgi:hypothetical protein
MDRIVTPACVITLDRPRPVVIPSPRPARVPLRSSLIEEVKKWEEEDDRRGFEPEPDQQAAASCGTCRGSGGFVETEWVNGVRFDRWHSCPDCKGTGTR